MKYDDAIATIGILALMILLLVAMIGSIIASTQCHHYGWDGGYMNTQLQIICVDNPTIEQPLSTIRDGQ